MKSIYVEDMEIKNNLLDTLFDDGYIHISNNAVDNYNRITEILGDVSSNQEKYDCIQGLINSWDSETTEKYIPIFKFIKHFELFSDADEVISKILDDLSIEFLI